MRGVISVPGDKSISHRAIILGSLSTSRTLIRNLLTGEDCLSTMEAFRSMGVVIRREKEGEWTIEGCGLRGLKPPKGAGEIYLGNSGTSMRLIAGVLAGQNFEATLTGDESLSKRPMGRIAKPLREMGADVRSFASGDFPPIVIKGGRLRPISYKTKVPSAQVKSCILLAGLYANGITEVVEPLKSRDHTERMLKVFGAEITLEGLKVRVRGNPDLKLRTIDIPGDISSASFLLVAAAMLPDSDVTITSVGLNPTRSAIINILKQMGADIETSGVVDDFEPYGNIRLRAPKTLKPIVIGEGLIPRLIDEIPIICVAASLAKGESRICGIGELRVKETDRINSIVTNLQKMGVDIKSVDDDIAIKGRLRLKPARLESFGDHRTAMSMAVAGLSADGRSEIEGIECINTSFPQFFNKIQELTNTSKMNII